MIAPFLAVLVDEPTALEFRNTEADSVDALHTKLAAALSPDRADELIDIAENAPDLTTVRQALNISFGDLNRALRRLGPPYAPLHDPAEHRRVHEWFLNAHRDRASATVDPDTVRKGTDWVMFDRPGIGIDDLPWIHRDQFVHHIELTHALTDPNDWPRFRQQLLRSLTAAFGLTADGNGDRPTPAQHRALQLLDDIRRQHDPAIHWPAFFDDLWSRRHAIRGDLA